MRARLAGLGEKKMTTTAALLFASEDTYGQVPEMLADGNVFFVQQNRT